jgi:hypothetical protein
MDRFVRYTPKRIPSERRNPATTCWARLDGSLSWLDSCNRFAKVLMLQTAFNSEPTSS